MATLEQLKAGLAVGGLVAGERVTIKSVERHGNDTVEVFFVTDEGTPGTRILSRSEESKLEIETSERRWTFDADGDLFKLAAEARRIRLAHLFDPFVAVETSTIRPLPHQIEAVYERMLPIQPLRFLLADDPGAGKTIMSGLYLRELIVRGDVERCLIAAPGSLVEQWQEELWQKFQLPFDILSRDMVESARTGNPFIERDLLIVRFDQVSRNDDLIARVKASEWDLVIVDEAHKMSAHLYGNEIQKTKRFQLGEELGAIARHLLLLTATPHSGKDDDYRLFLSLLDRDRFGGVHGASRPDASDLMRRYVKESLRTFDGKPLFPERRATTVNYELSNREQKLYEAVTDYVTTGMDAAKRLEEGGDRRRGLAVGFALAALQRRLASSPEAIYRSLQRRKERLRKRCGELGAIADGGPAPQPDHLSGLSLDDLVDFDFDDWDDEEREQIEDEAIDEAMLAATVVEMENEILHLESLEKLAAAVRASGTDRKWEELSSILQSDAMTSDGGVRRKLIVFTEHKDTLIYLVARTRSLLGRPAAVVAIHGSVKRADRRRIQEAFTKQPDVHVLIATDAAGEGVNLQRANLMVNYDLPWNPNRIEQRFGRIHRIGQTEVCHLWNLVAYQTREGQVFQRLFSKIEEMRTALGDQVYDVLGDSALNRSLGELLIEAIRYGEQPEVKARMERVIDHEIGERFRDVLNERAVSSDLLSEVRVAELRDAMERAKARKLQPGFIRAFFDAAFNDIGGRIVERENGRFEITRVPATLRSLDREVSVGAPVGIAYERVTFDPDRIDEEGKPQADLLAPGHPLLSATVDVVLERHSGLLRQGAVLIDPDDYSRRPRVLVFLEHSVHDGRPASPAISRRFQFVEIAADGSITDPGPEPYLLYRSATPSEREILQDVTEQEWLSQALDETARSFAVAQMAAPHFEEVRTVTEAREQRVRRAVEERLAIEINYWDERAAELKSKELQGKKGRGGVTSGHARARADEMEARRQRRRRELDREADVSNLPPVTVGGALIIPQGLLDDLSGTRSPDLGAKDTSEVDERAVRAVLKVEERLGRHATAMDHANPGYDVESVDPETGTRYFIEVKGRIEGQDTVTVKVRQIRMGVNNPDSFVLASSGCRRTARRSQRSVTSCSHSRASNPASPR